MGLLNADQLVGQTDTSIRFLNLRLVAAFSPASTVSLAGEIFEAGPISCQRVEVLAHLHCLVLTQLVCQLPIVTHTPLLCV
ncbi:hypothetical protein ACVMIX_006441 [Rhizobium leguminosarum]